MNHRKSGKKLGRNHHERQALFRSLIKSMFLLGSIKTTESKAKAVLPLIEHLSHRIMTDPDLVARRELFRYFQNQVEVNQVVTLFRELYSGQSQNFTKMVRIRRRMGDDALIVKFSFTKSYPEKKKEDKTSEKKTIKPTKIIKPNKKIKEEK